MSQVTPHYGEDRVPHPHIVHDCMQHIKKTYVLKTESTCVMNFSRSSEKTGIRYGGKLQATLQQLFLKAFS